MPRAAASHSMRGYVQEDIPKGVVHACWHSFLRIAAGCRGFVRDRFDFEYISSVARGWRSTCIAGCYHGSPVHYGSWPVYLYLRPRVVGLSRELALRERRGTSASFSIPRILSTDTEEREKRTLRVEIPPNLIPLLHQLHRAARHVSHQRQVPRRSAPVVNLLARNVAAAVTRPKHSISFSSRTHGPWNVTAEQQRPLCFQPKYNQIAFWKLREACQVPSFSDSA
jgi:hypothetical protein